MPAYPCVQCNTQVDIRDLTCRSCGEKKPFKCSKCEKRLGAMDVYNAEQHTFQKPVFCRDCGLQYEHVPCPHCRGELMRSSGVEDDGVIYHADCFKAVQLQKKVAPILKIVLMIFLGYASYSLVAYRSNIATGVGVGLIAAVVGYFLGGLMEPRRK